MHEEMELMLKGYGLTTAHIFYRLPDHPSLLQTYLWQDYDLEPKYPALSKFLDFWNRELEGPIHSVRVGTKRLIHPSEFRHADFVGAIH